MTDSWFRFDETLERALAGRPVVVTFPGPGLVAGIAGEELVESLGAQSLGPVRSVRIPPHAVVTNGHPEWPIVFYDGGDAVILRCDADLPGAAAHRFAQEAHAFFGRCGTSRVVLLDALAYDATPSDDDHIFGVTGHRVLAKDFEAAGATPLEDGVLGGPTAAFLLWGEDAVPTGALVTNATPEIPDPRAAARLITTRHRVLALHVNVGELSERAEELEREVARLSRSVGLPVGDEPPLQPSDSAMYS